MLNLQTTSDVLRVVTGAAVTTIGCSVSWADIVNASGAFAGAGETSTAITTAATSTICAAPASGNVRNIRSVYISNNSASSASTVTVQKFNGTTAIDLITVTLLAGENLLLTEDGDWQHHDTNGAEYTYQVPAAPNLGLTGTLAENCPRLIAGTNVTAGTSGTLYLIGILLTAGQLVSNITLATGATAAGTPTNCFFALYSGSQTAPTLLASSANQTTAAWAANAVKTLPMTTPYRVPVTGLYYVGFMMTATTMPSLTGPPAALSSAAGSLAAGAPIMHGSANTGLTTSIPSTASTPIISGPARAYAAVS